MVKNNAGPITPSFLRLRWLACACIAAGLVVQAPEPAVASSWLERLFSSPSSKIKARKQRQELEARRKRQQAETRRSKKKAAAEQSRPAYTPLVDEDEPVQIIVSLPNQRMTVYKGGVQILTTRISSGKAGHTTPAGVFSILQKNRRHFSNLYDGAPMPFMQRLTWSGVALHAGVVPNYPASHGCIRMPHAFARQLFGMTDMGGQVLVTTGDDKVQEITHAKLFQPAPLATIFDPKYLTAATRGTEQTADAATAPEEAHAAPTFDGADRRQVSTKEAPASKRPLPANRPRGAAYDIRTEKLHVYEGRDDRPLRILITRRGKRERILDIQEMLNQLGYKVGKPDGKVGRGTREAIRDFQKEQGLKVTGRESEELWKKLNSATGTWRFATGHLYVRQGMVDIFDTAVTINQPSEPLGTHVYTAMDFDTEAISTRWTAVTIKQSRPPRSTDHINDEETLAKANAVTAPEALERIEIPDRVRRRIEAMLTPASYLIISDNGMDARETTKKGTDFIVRTW